MRRKPHKDNIATLVIWLKSGAAIRVPVKEYNANVKDGQVTSLSWTTVTPSPVLLKAIKLEEVAALTEEPVR